MLVAGVGRRLDEPRILVARVELVRWAEEEGCGMIMVGDERVLRAAAREATWKLFNGHGRRAARFTLRRVAGAARGFRRIGSARLDNCQMSSFSGRKASRSIPGAALLPRSPRHVQDHHMASSSCGAACFFVSAAATLPGPLQHFKVV
eukprot:jgi/Tetstr1/464411/TSEL_009203.t1